MKKFTYLSSFALLAIVITNADALTPECPDIASSDKSVTSSPSIIGIATDPVSNALLYCEYHYPKNNKPTSNSVDNNNPATRKSQFLVEYRNADQRLIAQKKLSYKDNLLQPEVIQEDLRHGERREVFLSRNNEMSTFRVQYQKPDSGDIKQKDFAFSSSLVVDAGFDEAVRQNWTRLLAGAIVKMDFLSPVHLKIFNLSMKITNDDRFIIEGGGGDQTISFLIRPSNSFINLFAEPLLLNYDKNSQRLLAYSGNVNITSNDGNTMVATIQYYYRQEIVPK
ncbi:MAG: hypothetical protein ACJAUP_000961 [Cellvibrionaceae bacterium]|jgi:hypothetical protein